MKKKLRPKKKSTIFPGLKKDIRDFLVCEEGKITKKGIVKIGITLGILGFAVRPDKAVDAAPSPFATHDSAFFTTATKSGHASHASHASHSSHGSHGNCCMF